MGKLVFGMMQSLDGYIAGPSGELRPPSAVVHQHFNDHVRGVSGMLYGRRIYDLMRYWDEAKPDWEEIQRDYAEAWRGKPKWVASRTLESVGPNASLVQGDVCAFAARLKAERDGEIDVAGAELAGVLSDAGHLHMLKKGRLKITRPDARQLVIDKPSILFFPRPRIHRLHSVDEDGAELA